MIIYVLIQCFVSIIMGGLKVTIYELFLFYVFSRLTRIIILQMNYCGNLLGANLVGCFRFSRIPNLSLGLIEKEKNFLSKLEEFIWVVDLPPPTVL